jgi:hypothetical protein
MSSRISGSPVQANSSTHSLLRGNSVTGICSKKGLEAMDQLAKHVLRVVEDITEQTEETIRRADLETITYRALRIES